MNQPTENSFYWCWIWQERPASGEEDLKQADKVPWKTIIRSFKFKFYYKLLKASL